MICRIVAELSGNHNGSLNRALDLVEAAAAAGADAVKIQTFTPEQMASPETVVAEGPWKGLNLLDLYRETHIPRDWIPMIFERARGAGLEAFSSVFHPDDIAFLETLGCPRYKIASFELVDLPLIRAAAATGKPIILSTGMGTIDEIVEAFYAARTDPTLLICTSAYPADASDANLARMAHLRHFFNTQVGLSDHTPGIGVAVAAAALGASMIEKHLTLARSDGGPDAEFSMEPDEFAQLVIECRRAEAAIGEPSYGPRKSEAPSLALRRTPGGKRG